jgi:putative membrane protein insertion efficiency factor
MGDIEECCEAACCIGAIYVWAKSADGAELPKNLHVSHGEQVRAVQVVENQPQIEEPSFILRGIRHYQEEIGPEMKKRLGREDICRFEPTCSEFARQAVEKHGSYRGSLMAIGRLIRCNPFSKGGYDPVR